MKPFPDKVIPGGNKCAGCEYTWMAHGGYWFCALFDTTTELRTEECIAALPNGGEVETRIKVPYAKEAEHGK